MNFQDIKTAVAAQFERMSKYELFRTDVPLENVVVEGTVVQPGTWDTYLASFPEGSDPIYRVNTEHTCACCKGFFRAVGNVVAIIEGRRVTVWDVEVGDPSYQVVVDALAKLVRSKPIANVFFHFERTAGTDKSRELMNEKVVSWSHFFVHLPAKYVKPIADIPTAMAGPRVAREMVERGLASISNDALDTALDLIAQGAIYKGPEFIWQIDAFKKLKKEFSALPDKGQDAFMWAAAVTLPIQVTGIHSKAIGVLLGDLSEEEMELKDVCTKFNVSVAAPTNWKMPTALVSKKQIEEAQAQIEKLGLSSALDRRYATAEDVSINHVLYANRSVLRSKTGNVFADLAATVPDKKVYDKVDDVAIEDFIKNILPRAESIELLVENRHVGNLMSLVAPDAGALKKTEELARRFKVPFARADKKRDPITGKLSGAVVYCDAHIGKKNFLIVDDICDGGRTFLSLEPLLREYTDGQVNLYVTHGIFSAGLSYLAAAFDNVYFANPHHADDLEFPTNVTRVNTI